MAHEFKSAVELEQAFQDLVPKIEALEVHKEFVIEDYPIGGSLRGKCKLSIELKKNHGWRTVKQTTDKYGRWCKPKASTYRSEGLGFIVSGPIVEKEVAWLEMSNNGIYLQAANGEHTKLIEAPCYFKPNPVERPNPYGGIINADSPELCEAWAAWENGRNHIAKILKLKAAQLAVAGKEVAVES